VVGKNRSTLPEVQSGKLGGVGTPDHVDDTGRLPDSPEGPVYSKGLEGSEATYGVNNGPISTTPMRGRKGKDCRDGESATLSLIRKMRFGVDDANVGKGS